MDHRTVPVGLLFLCLGLWPGWAWSAGQTYYVDNSGSPSASCSPGNPSIRRDTMNGGFGCLSGGDTLVVGAGNYDECVSSGGHAGYTAIPSGSGWGEGVQTTIKAEEGADVWIKITNLCSGDQAHVIRMELDIDSWIWFERINVDANLVEYSYCTDTGNARHVTFSNMELKNSHWSACHQGGGKWPCAGGDINYLNNHVHHCGLGTPQEVGSHCYYTIGGPMLIEGGEVHHANTYGIQLSSEAKSACATVRNVHVHDVPKAIVYYGSGTIYNNLITNTGQIGLHTAGGPKFYNNTMYNCGSTACINHNGTGSLTYYNNIMLGSGPAIQFDISGVEGDSSKGTNLCAGTGGGGNIGCTVTGTPSSVWENPAAGDFRLKAGSPAIDAGTNLSSDFTTDMTGLMRAIPWDLGACEAGVASCSAGVSTSEPPAPASLAFGSASGGQPSTTVVGATMAPVKVRVMDSTFTLLPGSGIPITLQLEENPGGGTLSGTLTRNADASEPGIAVFDNLSMNTLGSGKSLRATTTTPGPCAGTVCPDVSAYFNIVPAAGAALTPPIKVDQFGYLPTSTKVAVLSDPQTGFNAADTYTPGSLTVKTSPGGATVFTGTATQWNGGATQAQSGDRLWWFDFSSVTTPGQYYIHDTTNDIQSDIFAIEGNAYDAVLTAALRMFYYQRSGLAKTSALAGANWVDGAAFLGTGQDTAARSVVDQANAGTAQDVRGGWFDAGDYNKYTIWGAQTVNDLLTVYQQAPTLWSDAIGIPESGNGLPDIVDEAKWELDWLLRMQPAPMGGAVLSKVSVLLTEATSPPSADTRPRYWGAASTAATAASAAAFAQGAIVFAALGASTGNATWTNYANTLTTAAQNAWTWTMANPSVTYPNTGFATANPDPCGHGCPYGMLMERLRAAIYLYARTGTPAYKTFVEGNYTTAHAIEWGYWYYSEAYTQDALLYYASLPGATLAIRNQIKASAVDSIAGADFITAWNSALDGYRAYLKDGDYTWGSNRNKASTGTLYTNLLAYGLGTAPATYRTIAEAYAHGLHGVNPMGMAYLTRMGGLGAERSATEMYHSWFADGTVWDNALTSPNGPPPGFLTSGPYPGYSGTASPPLGQPIQKSYKDWNGVATGDKSYEITEPGIYYQSAYLRLLSQLVPIPTSTPTSLAFGTPQPSNTVAGAAIAPPVTVRVLDAGGVLIPTAVNAVTIAIQTNPVGGTLSCGGGGCTKPAEGGVATFSTLSINTVGTGYQLGATSGGLTSAQSDLFAITAVPAAPTELSIFLHSTGNFLAR